MSLIRASRIATTATVEELMKAVRELRENPSAASVQVSAPPPPPAEPAKPAAPPPPPVAPRPAPPPPPAPAPAADFSSRRDILDDPKLNSILASLPGATITDIKEPTK
jgi:hypothetical protein